MYCVLCGKKKWKFWDIEYRVCTQKCAASSFVGLLNASPEHKSYCEKCGGEWYYFECSTCEQISPDGSEDPELKTRRLIWEAGV